MNWIKIQLKRFWKWLIVLAVGITGISQIAGIPPNELPIETPLIITSDGVGLNFDEDTRKVSGVRILVDIRTGYIVNDFQGVATEGTLIGNAVRAKLGKASDFEEVFVSEEDYKNYIETYRSLIITPAKINRISDLERVCSEFYDAQ